MPIQDYVEVVVTKEGSFVSRQGLGTPAFINDNAIQDANTRFVTYASMDEIADAGFTDTDHFYLWAQTVFSQNPCPSLVASIWWDDSNAETLATALDAAYSLNGDEWYFHNLDSRADADISAVASWTEAKKKIFIAQSSSADMKTSTEPNIGNTLNAANYNRTALLWHADDDEYADGAWTGRCAAFDLDSANGVGTWALKELAGITVNALTSTQQNNIRAYKSNIYVKELGRGVTSNGTVASGWFIDEQTTFDWTYFRTTERVFAVLATTPTKVPYTDAGAATIQNEVLAVLKLGSGYGHFDPAQEIKSTVPSVKVIDKQLKANRILPDVIGTAYLASAIHKVLIKVKVSI